MDFRVLKLTQILENKELSPNDYEIIKETSPYSYASCFIILSTAFSTKALEVDRFIRTWVPKHSPSNRSPFA